MSEDAPGPVSADKLRMMLLEKQMAEYDKRQAARAEEEKRLSAFTDSFMKEQVTEEERAMIRRIVMQAVQDGKFEAMVYSFPSVLCTDSGRAINNAEPNWPDTLQGKAKELYDRYAEVARPAGYKLSASIVNFPGGVPGDVGLFLSWAPEAV